MSGQLRFPPLQKIVKEAVKEAVAEWLEAHWPKPPKEEPKPEELARNSAPAEKSPTYP